MSICWVDGPCMRGMQSWGSETERTAWQRNPGTVSPGQVPIMPQCSSLGNTGCLAVQLWCAEVWTQFSHLSSITWRIEVPNARAGALWTSFFLMDFLTPRQPHWVSLVAQTGKNLPAIQETWVWFLGQENPLEKGMATHSRIVAWWIPWTEEPWATVHGVTKNGTWLRLPQAASLPFGDTLWAFHLPWWLQATHAFLPNSSSVSLEGGHLLSLDLLQMLQGLLVFILDLLSPGKGILQARILEWVAISYSRGSSWPRDWARLSCISCTDH